MMRVKIQMPHLFIMNFLTVEKIQFLVLKIGAIFLINLEVLCVSLVSRCQHFTSWWLRCCCRSSSFYIWQTPCDFFVVFQKKMHSTSHVIRKCFIIFRNSLWVIVYSVEMLYFFQYFVFSRTKIQSIIYYFTTGLLFFFSSNENKYWK